MGIGKANPNAKLDISGSVIITGSLTVSDGSYANTSIKFAGGNAGFFRGSDGRIEVIAGGFTALQIYSDQLRASDGTAAVPGVAFSGDGGASSGIFKPQQNTLGFSSNGVERARIDSAGNFGISKTTNLNAKLDINGNTIISGSLNVTTSITSSLFGTSSYAVTASYIDGGLY